MFGWIRRVIAPPGPVAERPSALDVRFEVRLEEQRPPERRSKRYTPDDPRMLVEEFWIRGEAQKNADGTSRQQIINRCRVGEPISLLREPENPHDRNAVAVVTRSGQIGYIAREDAADVARRLEWGEQPECAIARIVGGTRDKPYLGVVIAAAWPEAFRVLARRVDRLEEARGTRVLDLHFAIQELIEVAYAAREKHPAALDTAIAACERQIALAPRAAQFFRRQYPNSPLPSHVGFHQLAIIREKQRQFEQAIALSKQATDQGWAGDWDRRIERCVKKAAPS